MSSLWAIAASTVVLAYATTWMARCFAPKIGFLDAPDGARKTHQGAMPLLGGLAVFFAFWVAPGPILERPGTILEVQNLVFRSFVALAGLQCENIAHVQKPQFFLGFCMVFTHRKFCAQAKKRHKIVPQTFRTELPTKIA